VGGAADQVALALGNALVGNPPDTAALEIALSGPVLVADEDLACVVWGAPLELFSDRQRLRAGTTFTLRAGEALHIDGTARGMRGYFCIRGGLQLPLLLGSRSALRPLTTGVELPCTTGVIRRRFLRSDLVPSTLRNAGADPAAPRLLRILDGPQADWFPQALFPPDSDGTSSLFTVGPASNRMGLRLEGEPLPVPARQLVSEPVCPGSIQVTSEGQCIILGVDGQTIGGYPKIAQVISADLDELGQLRPGEQLRFQRVSLEEAVQLYRRKQAQLHEWVTRLLVTA
jgi:antagonist of KipI